MVWFPSAFRRNEVTPRRMPKSSNSVGSPLSAAETAVTVVANVVAAASGLSRDKRAQFAKTVFAGG